MKFQSILNAIALLANRQKGFLCKIIKKSGVLSSTTLFISSVSTIGADDIKKDPSLQYRLKVGYSCPGETTATVECIRNISLATVSSQRTFDYDPSMLPEVAEVIFALRVKHANIGEPFVINFSGNYLLEFTKDKINIVDTYTKNRDVYEYQSKNPNITIGLGVSKGLPGNYKSIVIKEDAHGQLYNYAALYSDNITTDETMLSETLSHPFFEVARQGAVENTVNVTKAMTFYRQKPSHSRHARCIKSSSTILDQFMEIFRSGSAVCGPKSAVDIRSANHKTAAEMKLEKPLVEATVNTKKYPERLGFHLQRVDLHGKNPVALLAAAYFCKKSVLEIIGYRRKKRALDDDHDDHDDYFDYYDCDWGDRLVSLYMSLKLDFNDIYPIVESVRQNHTIPAHYFPNNVYLEGTEVSRGALVELISKYIDEAAAQLQLGAAVYGQAAGAPEECPAECQSRGESTVAEGGIEIYILNGEEFKPVPNLVKTIKRDSSKSFYKMSREDDKYTTKVIYVHDKEQKNDRDLNDTIAGYSEILREWIKQIRTRKRKTGGKTRTAIGNSLFVAEFVLSFLNDWKNHENSIIATVYHDNVLIGISVGRIRDRTYYPEYEVMSPESLFADHGSFSLQLEYLTSEVIKFLLSKGLIDKSEKVKISNKGIGIQDRGCDGHLYRGRNEF